MQEESLNSVHETQNGISNGTRELTEQELRALIDEAAKEGLGISGEEYLYRLHAGTIPRSGGNGYLAHLSMLACLLDD